MNLHRSALIGATFLLAAMATPTAHAAESFDGCVGRIASLPAVITTQGTWCMDKDLATAIASGDAIAINTNNVTLDCNGFKLGGLAAGTATQATGIGAYSRRNITVRNCSVRGFRVGIRVGSSGQLVEHNRIEGSTVLGLWIVADQTLIRDNLVIDTGGSTEADNVSTTGIMAVGTVDVAGNTIDGVTSTGTGSATGIVAQGGPVIVRENSVRNLFPAIGSSATWGIYVSSAYGAVRDNNLFGTVGLSNSAGIYCSNDTTTAVRDNVIGAFSAPTSNCSAIQGNQIL